MKKISEVRYVVTDAFGNNNLGDVRVAYVVGGEGRDEPCLLFHPKDRGYCASLEICRAREIRFEGKDLYESATPNSYVNLSTHQRRRFEAMLAEAGIELPPPGKNVVATEVKELLPQPTPRRARRPG